MRVGRPRELGGERRDRRLQRRRLATAGPRRSARPRAPRQPRRRVRAPTRRRSGRPRRRAPPPRSNTCTCPRPITVSVPGRTGVALAVDQSASRSPRASTAARGSRAGAAPAARARRPRRSCASSSRTTCRSPSGDDEIRSEKSMHRRRPAIRIRAVPRDPSPMTATPQTPTLPATLTLGAVHLTVADLDRSVAWYQRSLGLRVHAHERHHRRARRRHDDRPAPRRGPGRAPAGRHAGLYHYALLYPTPRGARPRRGAPVASPRRRSTAPPTTAPTRRSTCPTPTATASSWPPTAPETEWPQDLGYARGPAPLDFRGAAEDDRGRGAHRRTSSPACAWATCTCTSATSTAASRSTATCSASSSRPTSAARRS